MKTSICKTFKIQNVGIHIIKSDESKKGFYVLYCHENIDPIEKFNRDVWSLDKKKPDMWYNHYPVHLGLSYEQAEKRMKQMIEALNFVTFETIEL